MPSTTKKQATPGIKPEWLKIPRRKCDYCGKSYKPARPKTRFCCKQHLAAFHANGSAFPKLREVMVKEIVKQKSFLEKCDTCGGTGIMPRKLRALAQLQSKPACTNCINGKMLTALGKELADFLALSYGLQGRIGTPAHLQAGAR